MLTTFAYLFSISERQQRSVLLAQPNSKLR